MFTQKQGVQTLQKSSKVDRTGILDPVRSSPDQENITLYSSRFAPAITPSILDSRRRRIILYSHDTMGLGRTRRNMLIAQRLAASSLQVDILMISGMWEASKFLLPPNVDCLTLPALYKNPEGQYQARRLSISLKDITRLRSKIIQAAVEGFEPDILIVDKEPRGVMRELDATLKYLHTQGHTRCILGGLDKLAAVQEDWNCSANEDAIRDYYDAIWIDGDPTVYSTAHEYHFSQNVGAKIRYTGYLDQRAQLKYAAAKSMEALIDLGLPPGELVLCMAGDGQDGAHLAEAFAQAEMPPETNGVILTNPFMPLEQRQKLHQYVARRPRLRVLEYVADPAFLLEQANRVISTESYNTTDEVLSGKKRVLIVSRTLLQREKQIQAERWRRQDLLDLLHPHQVSPQALTTWLTAKARDSLNLNDFDYLPQLIEEMLAPPHSQFTIKC